jgi:hypothetical protein
MFICWVSSVLYSSAQLSPFPGNGLALRLSANGGNVFVIGMDNGIYNGNRGWWRYPDGLALDIAMGNGVPYVIGMGNDIWRYKDERWQVLPGGGRGKRIAWSDERAWMIGIDNRIYWHDGVNWNEYAGGGNATDLAVWAGKPYIVDLNGVVMRGNGFGWEPISGNLRGVHIAADQTGVWMVGSNTLVYNYDGTNWRTTSSQGQFLDITVDDGAVYVISADNTISRMSVDNMQLVESGPKPVVVQPVAAQPALDGRSLVTFVNKNFAGRQLNYDIAYEQPKLQVVPFNWKLIPAGQAQYYIRAQVKGGKYWGLTGKSGDARLDEPASDLYQVWQIEQLPDGYLKVANAGLLQNNQPAYLYSDENSLFFHAWEENTGNGRWLITSSAPLPPDDDQPDPFDNRYFTLVSASNNAPMCFKSESGVVGDIMTTDFLLTICDREKSPSNVRFTKTVNGDYFMQMNIQGTNDFIQIDSNLKPIYGSQMDPLKVTHNPATPADNDTWTITNVKGFWKITNSANGALELNIDPYSAKISVQLRTRDDNRFPQNWYLR